VPVFVCKLCGERLLSLSEWFSHVVGRHPELAGELAGERRLWSAYRRLRDAGLVELRF